MSDYYFNLEQGSYEWHQLRARHDTASQAPSVLEVNPWKPRNQRELYALREGKLTIEDNAAMARGRQYEDEARRYLSNAIGEDLMPCVVVNGPYLASMDGLTADCRVGAEIKVPTSPRLAQTINDTGSIPIHYLAQLAQQMYCCDRLEHLVFFVYSPELKKGMCEVSLKREDLKDTWAQVREAWQKFHTTNHPPLEIEMESSTWLNIAHEYAMLDAKQKALKSQLDDLRAELLRMADNPDCPVYGGGVRVTPVVTAAKPERTVEATPERRSYRITVE